MDALREILSRLGRPEALEPLLAYVTLLERLGRGTNLIGPLSRDRILSELIADALLPAMARPPLGPLLDIGSGAGLPGLPLAITFPELPVHLVEPRQKRVTFLKTVTRRLGLTQVQIHGQRIEAFTACAPPRSMTRSLPRQRGGRRRLASASGPSGQKWRWTARG